MLNSKHRIANISENLSKFVCLNVIRHLYRIEPNIGKLIETIG